jgi:transposase
MSTWFRWRHQYQEGLFGPVSQSATLLPVQVIEAPMDLPQVVKPQASVIPRSPLK